MGPMVEPTGGSEKTAAVEAVEEDRKNEGQEEGGEASAVQGKRRGRGGRGRGGGRGRAAPGTDRESTKFYDFGEIRKKMAAGAQDDMKKVYKSVTDAIIEAETLLKAPGANSDESIFTEPVKERAEIMLCWCGKNAEWQKTTDGKDKIAFTDKSFGERSHATEWSEKLASIDILPMESGEVGCMTDMNQIIESLLKCKTAETLEQDKTGVREGRCGRDTDGGAR